MSQKKGCLLVWGKNIFIEIGYVWFYNCTVYDIETGSIRYLYDEICDTSFGYPFCQFNEPVGLPEDQALRFGIEEDGCNFTTVGESGIIQSPLFGESEYLPNTYCIYSIPVPPEKFLKLEITNFDVELPNR